MPLPLAWPVIIEGAAALSAALGLTAIVTSNKNEHSNSGNTERLNNAFVQQNLPLMIATNVAKAKMQQPAITNIPTEENALVLRPEYRTVTAPIEALNIFGYKPLLMEDTLPPLRGDETIPESPEQGPGIVIVEETTTVPGGPGEPYRQDPEDDENWYERLKRKRNEHRREKAEIESKRADAAERRLDAEEARLKMSRDRIAADKAYQDFLRNQGRSIPRPSAWQRPVSQGISKFFGYKGPATTNRFYNSPAMGLFEWTAATSPITIPTGIKIKEYINKSDKSPNTDIDVEKSSNGTYIIEVE